MGFALFHQIIHQRFSLLKNYPLPLNEEIWVILDFLF